MKILDGELYISAKEAIGIKDSLKNNDTESLVLYDPSTGTIYEDGETTVYRVALDSDGRFKANEDGSLMLLDEDGNVVTDEALKERYTYSSSFTVYSEDSVQLALNSVTEVS